MADDSDKPDVAPPRRRWLRWTVGSLAVAAAVVGGAGWLLGRESTLQALVQRIANASGGEIAVNGVSGSLYHRMHIAHLVYRGKNSTITADNIDINWSPLQYFSADGLAISELHIASLLVRDTAPSEPSKMPASLAAPLRIRLTDAQLDKLTLQSLDGSQNEIGHLRFQLSGDREGWRLRDAAAQTEIGNVSANLSIAATKPFAIEGSAALTQTIAKASTGAPASSAAAASAKPARLTLQAHGNLAQLELKAQGSAGAATGNGTLLLAPYDPIILRSLDLTGQNINPAGYAPGWPQADLSVRLSARIAQGQHLSGQLTIRNQRQPAPLDKDGMPLQAIVMKLGGTLAQATLEDVDIDLGPAGRFTGGGAIHRSGPDAPVDTAAFKLRTSRLDLQALYSAANKTSIAGDIAFSSGAGKQDFSAVLSQQGLRLDLQATLAKDLLQLRQARLQATKGSISATGQASLKDKEDFKASLRAEHFDPAALGRFPSADLNAAINASGHLSPAWQVATDFTLQPSKFMGQPLSGAGKLKADAQHISDAEARIAIARNTLEARGSFGATGEQLRWKLDAPQLSTISSDLLGALNANGSISGTLQNPRTSFEADARGLGLASAKHPVSESLLHASGEIAFNGKHVPELNINGSAQRFNPVAFGPYPSGAINADFKGQMRLEADWRAALNLNLQTSALSGVPLSGYARLAAAPGRIDSSDIDLHLGANSLQAKGAFGNPSERLDWKLDAPQLANIGPQFGGALRASGALSGTLEKPALAMTMDGANLHLPGQRQIKTARGSATLGTTSALASGNATAAAPSAGRAERKPREVDVADVPLISDIELTGIDTPGLKLDKLRLQTSGTRSAHVLQVSASNADFDAAVRLKGGWSNDTWTGVIDTLQNRGRYALTLQAPASLRLSAPDGSGVAGLAHPEQIALGGAAIKLPDGAIRIDYLEKSAATWRSKGQATGVPANYLAQLSEAWRDNVRSDMTLGADWSLNLQAASKGAAPALDGAVHVFREKGDLTMTGGDIQQPLGLRTLDARVEVNAGTLRALLTIDGERAGQAGIQATTQLRDGRLADDSPLAMSGAAAMGSISWMAPLTGQAGLEMDGTLKLVMSGTGTIGAPQLTGDISGDKLVLNWADQGVKLRNGQLQARLTGDQLQLQKLQFDGAEGHASADGWIRFANAEATMQLHLNADKLEALARPDRTLVVSGSSTLVRDSKHFQLDGKFRADRARIELASENTPTMSDDVVIVGRGAAPAKASQSMPLNIDIEADLGDDFHLKGHGLDAQLAGSVRMRVADRRPPRVNGSIRVTSGTYAAYGQKLAIERGVINFTGAYDNPGLSILAVRKRPEGEQLTETNVEAGVEVRGTALAPSAKLVSTPTVPDSDKLSWLVLGHGIDSTAGNEMALLGTAAGALFGGGQGKLANSLGLDELGVGQASPGSTPATAAGTPASGLQNTVVTVGKRLSSRAYLSFEQGAGTATSLVKLRYQLNPRITLQFQTGTNNALDVLYTWAFD
jgi:translocation and assembly module TamB